MTREPQDVQATIPFFAAPAPITASCPRCGYDLRGEVERWTDACPLEGMCGECGLPFSWSTLLRPGAMPRWLVEHPRARWFAGTRTLCRSLVPWRFWDRVRMSMPFSFRLATYPLRLAVIVLVASVVVSAARSVILNGPPFATDHEAALAGVAGALLMPWSAEAVDVVVEAHSPGWANRGPPIAPNVRRFDLILSARDGTLFMSRTLMPPPRDLWDRTWSASDSTIVAMLATIVASLGTFAVLPIVRKRAKVKWSHLVRVATYSLGVVVIVVLGGWMADVAEDLLGRGPRVRVSGFSTFSARMHQTDLQWALPALFVWWLCAARTYLRVDRPVAVALSVTVIGSLVGVLAFGAVDPWAFLRLLRLSW